MLLYCVEDIPAGRFLPASGAITVSAGVSMIRPYDLAASLGVNARTTARKSTCTMQYTMPDVEARKHFVPQGEIVW